MKVKEFMDLSKVNITSNKTFTYQMDGHEYVGTSMDDLVINVAGDYFAKHMPHPVTYPEDFLPCCPVCGKPMNPLIFPETKKNFSFVADSLFLSENTNLDIYPIYKCDDPNCESNHNDGAFVMGGWQAINLHPLKTHFFMNADIYKGSFESDLTNAILKRVTDMIDDYADGKSPETKEDYITKLVSMRECLTDIVYNEVHAWTIRQGLSRF